jgi:hypothetical protein
MKRTIYILLSLLIPILSQAQKSKESTEDRQLFLKYYPSGKIHYKGYKINNKLVDTLWVFSEKGKIQVMQVQYDRLDTNKIFHFAIFKGRGGKSSGGYLIKQQGGTYILDSVWKYYRKNGSVMDSVIYKNNKQIYRARLNSKGKIVFEEK